MAVLRAGLDAPRRGCGFALALRGEAGIGKTALLSWAREQAPDLAFVSTCGIETETHLPYAGLLQLVEPLLHLREELPPQQKSALEGALALAPPAPGDRFTVCVAFLGLLRLAARERPLLVVVDDAHWLDAASAECVAFAARRLGDVAVAMLLALRDGEPVAAGLDGLARLNLTPLEGDEAAAVVAEAVQDLAGAVLDAVVAASAGNPLALLELASSLGPAQRAGRAPLPDPLPAAGRLASVFDRRLQGLGPEGRDALALAAACDGGDVALLTKALEMFGLGPSTFHEAETAGLVVVEQGRLRFAHPLLRSAAWQATGAPKRRDIHRALSAVTEGDRRAWHLAESVTGPDHLAAEALAAAAARAVACRGYAQGSLAWQRCAELTDDRDTKARRLLRACNAAVAAGQMQRGLALLDEALALGSPISFTPRTLHTRCLLLLGAGEVGAAFELLRSLAEAAAGSVEQSLAAITTADAGMAALLLGDMREVLALGRRASVLLGGGGDALARAQVGACLAAGLIFRGETAEGREVLAGVEHDVLDIQDQELALRTHSMIIHLRTALEDYEAAHAHAHGVLETLAAISAHAASAAPLGHAADAAHRLGLWDLAESEARDAILVAEETSNRDALPRALVVRARLAAARGEHDLAQSLLDRAEGLVAGKGNLTIQSYVVIARGLLHLGAGDPAEAMRWLEQVQSLTVERAGLLHPSILPWRTDFVEACLMLGRDSEAAAAAATLEDEARASGGAAGLAMAARAAGMVAGDDFADHFERALALDEQRPMPFERARTLLAYGVRLHRAKRRAVARERLREAESIFESLGARPWRDRTAAELAAAGGRRRLAQSRIEGELTDQERRIAAALATGRTIREAATSLFLSPKTVDSHLRQVYAKLGIHSRAELALVATQRGWLER